MELIKGCNYHTTWQSNRSMRFVLIDYDDTTATLATTRARKVFTTKLSDLVFIPSEHNTAKADRIKSAHWNTIKNIYNRCGLQPEDYGFTRE